MRFYFYRFSRRSTACTSSLPSPEAMMHTAYTAAPAATAAGTSSMFSAQNSLRSIRSPFLDADREHARPAAF